MKIKIQLIVGLLITSNAFAANQPDLVISSVVAPSTAKVRSTVNITSTVKNIGKAAAKAFTVRIYLSTDNIIDPVKDKVLGSWSTQLVEGTQKQVSLAPLIKNIPVGAYYLGLVADANNTVIEGNEANNLYVSPKPINLVANTVPSKWVFTGNDSIISGEISQDRTNLWQTDGTSSGTKLLKEFGGTVNDTTLENFTPLTPGKLLYIDHADLWLTDGTTVGTKRITDIFDTRHFHDHANLGKGKIVFPSFFTTIFDLAGEELAITDGTPAGTKLVKDINPLGYGTALAQSSSPHDFTAIGNGKSLFSATHPSFGEEPWVTDGTAAGTQLLKNIQPNNQGSKPNHYTALGNGKAIFAASDNVNGHSLWVTDGTPAGTLLLKAHWDFQPKIASLSNGKAIITLGNSLYATNGTAAGTKLITTAGQPSGLEPFDKGRALFRSNGAGAQKHLWITDGTSPGSLIITTLKGSNAPFVRAEIHPSVPLGNGLSVFIALDAANGAEPWITDGTAQGTRLIKDVWPGQPGSYMPLLNDGRDWRSLENGQALIRLNHPEQIDTAYWITDGTEAGTKLLSSVNPKLDSALSEYNNNWPDSYSISIFPIKYKLISK